MRNGVITTWYVSSTIASCEVTGVPATRFAWTKSALNRVYDPPLQSVYPPYKTDTLVNWEIGWKTEWLDRTLRWNAAAFLENWDNFQFLFLGPNSVTVVQNAASAQIRGFESDLQWAPVNGLLLTKLKLPPYGP